jgi:hypothetical protein
MIDFMIFFKMTMFFFALMWTLIILGTTILTMWRKVLDYLTKKLYDKER